MKYRGTLLTVQNIARARTFYEEVLQQQVEHDFGENIQFYGGFYLQLRPHFAKLIGVSDRQICDGVNDVELYFEEDDLDSLLTHLQKFPEIIYLHDVREHSWGQRVIRFYDPDNHLIEVAESMEYVAKRLLRQGLSVSETAERTQYPLAFVEQCRAR